jgi:hypothetical protein
MATVNALNDTEWGPREDGDSSYHLSPLLQALACRVDQVLTAMPPSPSMMTSTHPHAYKPLLIRQIVGADGNNNRDDESHDETVRGWPAATPLMHCTRDFCPKHPLYP